VITPRDEEVSFNPWPLAWLTAILRLSACGISPSPALDRPVIAQQLMSFVAKLDFPADQLAADKSSASKVTAFWPLDQLPSLAPNDYEPSTLEYF